MTTRIRLGAWIGINQDILNRQHLSLNALDALILIVRAADNEKVTLMKTRRASPSGFAARIAQRSAGHLQVHD